MTRFFAAESNCALYLIICNEFISEKHAAVANGEVRTHQTKIIWPQNRAFSIVE